MTIGLLRRGFHHSCFARDGGDQEAPSGCEHTKALPAAAMQETKSVAFRILHSLGPAGHPLCPETWSGLLVHRSFRSRISEADWSALRLTIVLVCRDALPATGDADANWDALATALARLGARVKAHECAGDLALCVLADFARKTTCRTIVARARALVEDIAEAVLRDMTEKAAAIADRTCRGQAFRFRATLVLISMAVTDALSEPLDVSSRIA
jgi:hypothetical protein